MGVFVDRTAKNNCNVIGEGQLNIRYPGRIVRFCGYIYRSSGDILKNELKLYNINILNFC